MGVILVLFFVLNLKYIFCYFENPKAYCDDLSPYRGEINLEQVVGVWYGIEKINHLRRERNEYDSTGCFYIDIKEQYTQPSTPAPYYMQTNSPYIRRDFGIPEHYRTRYFVVEWHEGIRQDDYHVKVNTSHKGFWPTDLPNRSVEDIYRFFGGVIQVLKMSDSHLVLNFCLTLPYNQLFSVILARNENQLTYPEEMAEIHSIFTEKHLSTSARKRVCDTNFAISVTSSSYILAAALYSIWRIQK